eukprot:13912647-Alexandrium_andersonii.AAC.1
MSASLVGSEMCIRDRMSSSALASMATGWPSAACAPVPGGGSSAIALLALSSAAAALLLRARASCS